MAALGPTTPAKVEDDPRHAFEQVAIYDAAEVALLFAKYLPAGVASLGRGIGPTSCRWW